MLEFDNHAQTSKPFEEARIGMESPSLTDLLKTIGKPSPLSSFQEPLGPIQVVIHRRSKDSILEVTGLAPFHTVEDLHRAIWLDSGKAADLYPKYTYLAFEQDEILVPALRTFVDVIESRVDVIDIPDPRTVIPARSILESFVDEAGNKNPVGDRPRGRTTLEDVFLKPMGELPTFHVFPFQTLLQQYPGPRPISQRDWYGLFYPYFPALESTDTGTMTPEDVAQSKKIEQVLKAKRRQVQVLDTLLMSADLPELTTAGVKLMKLQWTNTEREKLFEGVESTFFAAPVNEVRPFMRLIQPNATSMTKLYQPDPLQPPQVNDPVLLKGWVNEPIPIPNESFLFVKALLRKEEFGLRPLYGTLRLMDDTTADFTIEPPKEQRILDFRKDFTNLATILEKVTEDMPFDLEKAKLGSASLTIELSFDKPPSKQLRKKVEERLSYLNTLFQSIEAPKEDQQKSLLNYRYKAVSNFTSEKRINSYLTYLIGRKGIQPGQEKLWIPKMAEEFQISEDEALRYLQDYIEKATDVTTSDPEAKEFLVLHNPGIDISIYSINITTFGLQLYNIRAVDLQDIFRVCTAISLAFYGTDEEWEAALEEEDVTAGFVEKAGKAAAEVEEDELEEEEEIAANSIKEDLSFLASDDEEELENRLKEFAPVAASSAAAPVPVKAQPPKPQPQPQPQDEEKIVAYGWFIKRLQQLDPVLFDYKMPQHVKKEQYSTKCANNEDRYPLMLSESQYQQMRKLYAKEEATGRVGFVVYGVPNTKETVEAAKGKTEQIMILRYGSDPTNLHYYLCSKIICLRDLLPILEEDWNSTKGHNGEPKAPQTCPFCHGRKISDPKKPQNGETVFIRKNKVNRAYGHYYIGFLGFSRHPQGYELPCCFISREDIDWKDARFKMIRDAPRQTGLAADEVAKSQVEAAAEKAAELEDAYRGRQQLIVEYDVLRWRIANEYVLGSEKYPLEPGKLGLPSLELDSYFGQDSSSFVARIAIKQGFKSNAHGFIRMGVMNKISYLNQSLFAALAPLLGFNTISAVAKHFTDLITPRIFIHLNFGNLLLEFYDPADPDFPTPPDSVLASWSQKHLLISSIEDSKFELARFYRSYHRFIHYINDPNQRKELRHFVHALAEPDLLAPQGLTLVPLHYKGDPRVSTTPVEVLCPMMGLDINRYSNNTIGFMTFSDAGIWEPMIYIDQLSQTSSAKSDVYYAITPQQMMSSKFPQVARDRYRDEFVTKCQSAYRGAFTFQSGVDSRVLLPVSRALTLLQDLNPTGLVRDSYNHLVAITLKNPREGKYDEVLVPVVDDGNSFHNNTALKVYIGLKNVNLAAANDVFKLYQTEITPRLFPISNVYKIDSFVQTSKIVGYRLGGEDSFATLLLPCASPKSTEELQRLSAEATIEKKATDDFQFEYMINREIQISEKDDVFEQYERSFVLEKKQVDELYEHFRLSFSNWIATMESSEPRQFVEDLVVYKPWLRKPILPNYEKMRRLELYFGSVLRQWFADSDKPIETQNLLYRKDCIAIGDDEERCTDTCIMNEDDGKCKIHTPKEVQVRSSPSAQFQEAATYFINRLFDEIVRLPAKRMELMNKGVKRIQVPSTNIHIGDQWIIPENIPAWYELLRGADQAGLEQPQFYEEFSRKGPTKEEVTLLEEELRLYALPEALAAELSEEAKNTLAVQVIGEKDSNRVNVLRRYFGLQGLAESSGIDLTAPILTEISLRYKIPVIQVQVSQMPIRPVGRSEGSKITTKTAAYVLIPDFSEGPAILVMRDTVSDTIPVAMLKGKLMDSIETTRRVLKKVVKA